MRRGMLCRGERWECAGEGFSMEIQFLMRTEKWALPPSKEVDMPMNCSAANPGLICRMAKSHVQPELENGTEENTHADLDSKGH